MAQSVENRIADLVIKWLSDYGLTFYREKANTNNSQIDNALNEYYSKTGGKGGNKPDCKLILSDKLQQYYPVMIEFKGYKDKLVKLDDNGNVANRNKDNSYDFAAINSYAVNGAIHYANAILHFTTYQEIIAIGITGEEDSNGVLDYSISVYFVTNHNYGAGIKISDEYTDLSFLKPDYFDDFIDKAHKATLSTDDLEKIKAQKESEIKSSLSKLNNDIFKLGLKISESDRVYLVVATVISTMGYYDKVQKKYIVPPLDKNQLKSYETNGMRDGDYILQRVQLVLTMRNIPDAKIQTIINTITNTLTNPIINKCNNGESTIKKIFCNIYDDLGLYYKIDLTTDFTGMLFNEMYNWLGFARDKYNDVVLTPSYVCNLLVKLARINKDSYVWDYATGSGGLLVAAMNEMINDAKATIGSPQILNNTIKHIKAEQLLGLETLPEIYILAVLNMIMMGDGSSNIINDDSLLFDGNYRYYNPTKKFPANAFVLNPPYSERGKGMIFVEKAFDKMDHGFGAIIIQNSAGSGQAKQYNINILKRNTLQASIKMPMDLFVGKSSVQTCIYVFEIGRPHNGKSPVKFINFTNDGYERSARKKVNNPNDYNLKDKDHAKERYQELVDYILYGTPTQYISKDDIKVGYIDAHNGQDWNQFPVSNIKKYEDSIRNTIKEHLNYYLGINTFSDIKANEDCTSECLSGVNWRDFPLENLFDKLKVANIKYKAKDLPSHSKEGYDLPALSAGKLNHGLNYYVPKDGVTILNNVISISANGANTGVTFYQKNDFTVLQDAYAIKWKYDKDSLTENEYLYLVCAISHVIYGAYEWTNKAGWERIKSNTIPLPVDDNGNIDKSKMSSIVLSFKKEYIKLVIDDACKTQNRLNSILQHLDSQTISKSQEYIEGISTDTSSNQYQIGSDNIYGAADKEQSTYNEIELKETNNIPDTNKDRKKYKRNRQK